MVQGAWSRLAIPRAGKTVRKEGGLEQTATDWGTAKAKTARPSRDLGRENRYDRNKPAGHKKRVTGPATLSLISVRYYWRISISSSR